jgi:hypothetical protein
MYILRTLVALAAGLLVQSAAHSTQRNPLRYLTRVDDIEVHTPSCRVHAHSEFEITFSLHDGRSKIRLSLQPNHDIIADGATIQHLHADGTVTREVINRADHRIFLGDAFIQHMGHSEWINAGWARVNVHDDGKEPVFEGAFRIHGDHHHVMTSTNYRQTMVEGDPIILPEDQEYMIVWRDSDIIPAEESWDEHQELRRDVMEREASCTYDALDFNADESHPIYRGIDVRSEERFASTSPRELFARQIDGTLGGNGAGVNLASTIGNTAGCPSTRKVALVGMATDCTYTSRFPSKANVTTNLIQQVNTASQLYESTFNISLGIANVTIADSECPGNAAATQTPWNVNCDSGVDITGRLNLFSKWRGQFTDSNAYWTLMTTCNTGAAVGLAWLGQACVQGAQSSRGGNNESIAGANVVVRTPQEWQVFAHETGHTFGAVHDCNRQSCGDGTVTKQQCCPLSAGQCDANGGFIMNPSTGSGITNFSPCSVGNICSALGRRSVRSECLTDNKNVVTITGSQCGNGIVEAGEDCDCGGTQGCEGNPCCNPQTCKFTQGSACDFSNEECCTRQCQLASSGTICRASTGSCDPAETCSGSSATCPANVNAPDGTSCGAPNGGLTCASGQCTSRDLQCKTLMGSLTSGNDTYACSSQGCQLSCASPEFGPNTCFTMQQNFLDGTTCEGGGHCSNGACQGANIGNEIIEWINNNKPIFIPVVCVVGGLILIAVASCIWSSIARRRRRNRMPKPPAPGWNNNGPGLGGGWVGPRPPPRTHRSGGGHSGRSGRSNNAYPGQHAWAPSRSMSARYA